MKIGIYSLMLLIAMAIVACGGAAVPPVAPAATPFVSPTASPVQTPDAPEPGGGLITKPESAKWNNAPQAALNARKMLVEQLKVDVDLVGLVSAELVDWPDACMGIQTPGVMCAQVITTGYKVVLSANGLEYEFHTNESGDVVRPVTK
ncbi:hypothetical protein ANRL3_00323 [Anaerolineae bacterium]|nr:hypothetical protein ANRL3_00323 [Anaerolineae bacterium]